VRQFGNRMQSRVTLQHFTIAYVVAEIRFGGTKMAIEQSTQQTAQVNQPSLVNLQKARDSATYIADLILELRNLAKAENFRTLQGLLELGYYEAFALANPVNIPQDERDRLDAMERAARQPQHQAVA
jgi:hypothetical protein